MMNMRTIKREIILDHIFEKYTGQEAMEALSDAYPTSYKLFCSECNKKVKNGHNKR
jgi:hypothetical protein